MSSQTHPLYQFLNDTYDTCDTYDTSGCTYKGRLFLSPTKKIASTYIDLGCENIIVKPLVTESPLMLDGKVPVPTIEKLLVDTRVCFLSTGNACQGMSLCHKHRYSYFSFSFVGEQVKRAKLELLYI